MSFWLLANWHSGMVEEAPASQQFVFQRTLNYDLYSRIHAELDRSISSRLKYGQPIMSAGANTATQTNPLLDA